MERQAAFMIAAAPLVRLVPFAAPATAAWTNNSVSGSADDAFLGPQRKEYEHQLTLRLKEYQKSVRRFPVRQKPRVDRGSTLTCLFPLTFNRRGCVSICQPFQRYGPMQATHVIEENVNGSLQLDLGIVSFPNLFDSTTPFSASSVRLKGLLLFALTGETPPDTSKHS